MKETYRIAGVNIRIDSNYPDIHEKCSKFRTDGVPDVSFKLTRKDIEFEKKRRQNWNEAVGTTSYGWGDGVYETLAAHRKIVEYMPLHDTFMMHGSVVSVDDEAYLFTATSGTGKSTHTGLWRQLLGERAVMVDDDKPLLHVEEDGSTIANGTPWNGKHCLGDNIAVPLRAICFLERSEDNWIREIPKSEALLPLIKRVYRPSSAEVLSRVMDCVGRLKARFYRLGCNMDIEAARLSYETMSGKTV